MFNKKEMKLVKDYDKVQEYLMDGIPVFMVKLDGSLEEITKDTDWKTLFFHTIAQGYFAVYKKKFTIGTFCKDIRIGKWSFIVSHTAEGGDA